MPKAIEFSAVGVNYSLQFGWSAMVRFERETGQNAIVAAQSIQDALEDPTAQPAVTLTALFLAALRPKQDEDAVLDIMDEIGPERAMALLGEAIEVGWEAGRENPSEAAQSETG